MENIPLDIDKFKSKTALRYQKNKLYPIKTNKFSPGQIQIGYLGRSRASSLTVVQLGIQVIFPKVDDFVELIRSKGKGCLLFKRDLKRANRQISMDPKDFHLVSIVWSKHIFKSTFLWHSFEHGFKICGHRLSKNNKCNLFHRVANWYSHIKLFRWLSKDWKKRKYYLCIQLVRFNIVKMWFWWIHRKSLPFIRNYVIFRSFI